MGGEIFESLWGNFFPPQKEVQEKDGLFLPWDPLCLTVMPELLQPPCSALRCSISSGKPTLRKAELRTGRTRVFDDIIEPLNQPTLELALVL